MNILFTLRQIYQVVWGWGKSERCEVCDVPLLSGDFICENAACQMQALEAQAMLGSCTLKPFMNRRRTVPPLAAVLPAEPGSDGYAAPSAWAF